MVEWTEHGNLREFYTNNENSFDPKQKLRISLDIARGSNSLRTFCIVISEAENVLITLDNTAKLTKFKLSRSYKADTVNQIQNIGQIRYKEKTPYENLDDFAEITRLVLDRHRESFSENSQMPGEFKHLALDEPLFIRLSFNLDQDEFMNN
ncbi:hypothetical protein RhiirA5_423878 [Rhizophagus irregularis]|uniref:Serine-threonine/tyrosine-protein kinase catalytic domain-containing protein n=1 Tax=Rhizophagus irregularis TaxID=588596 RepID=A0A2N0P940_9GLOM|nr:hypothetical protein RhiirA5_423878 [Rhizophagus irregularis]